METMETMEVPSMKQIFIAIDKQRTLERSVERTEKFEDVICDLLSNLEKEKKRSFLKFMITKLEQDLDHNSEDDLSYPTLINLEIAIRKERMEVERAITEKEKLIEILSNTEQNTKKGQQNFFKNANTFLEQGNNWEDDLRYSTNSECDTIDIYITIGKQCIERTIKLREKLINELLLIAEQIVKKTQNFLKSKNTLLEDETDLENDLSTYFKKKTKGVNATASLANLSNSEVIMFLSVLQKILSKVRRQLTVLEYNLQLYFIFINIYSFKLVTFTPVRTLVQPKFTLKIENGN